MKKEDKKNILDTMEVSLTDLEFITQTRRQTISDSLTKLNAPHRVGPSNSKLYKITDILSLLSTVVPKQSKSPTSDVLDESEDKARLLRSKADIEEFKAAKLAGEMVSFNDVATVISEEYSQVRSQLLSLGESLCRELALESNPEIVSQLITTKINQILEALKADEPQK